MELPKESWPDTFHDSYHFRGCERVLPRPKSFGDATALTQEFNSRNKMNQVPFTGTPAPSASTTASRNSCRRPRGIQTGREKYCQRTYLSSAESTMLPNPFNPVLVENWVGAEERSVFDYGMSDQ